MHCVRRYTSPASYGWEAASDEEETAAPTLLDAAVKAAASACAPRAVPRHVDFIEGGEQYSSS